MMRIRILVAAALSLVSSATLYAQVPAVAPASVQTTEPVVAAARAYIENAAQAQAQAVGGTADVKMLPFELRLRVASCNALEAFMPPGARLSAHPMVGVRCTDPVRWQVFVPSEVHLQVPVWVATVNLPAGHTLESSDVTQKNTDWTPDQGPNRVLTMADANPVGQVLARSLLANMALHAQDMNDPSRVNPGQDVEVLCKGSGFTVTGDGKAIGSAVAGQQLQVRMPGGTIVTGTLGEDRKVVMTL